MFIFFQRFSFLPFPKREPPRIKIRGGSLNASKTTTILAGQT